jgi:hypothetical protein
MPSLKGQPVPLDQVMHFPYMAEDQEAGWSPCSAKGFLASCSLFKRNSNLVGHQWPVIPATQAEVRRIKV